MLDDSQADGDDLENITAEDLRVAEQRCIEYGLRHPTFLLVWKVVTRRARLLRLRAMKAPALLLETEQRQLDEALDVLCQALPFDEDTETYSLPLLVRHFLDEHGQLGEKT